MNVLTFPRAVLATEYKAVRLPLSLLDHVVLSPWLGDDAGVTLAVERALGTLDEAAGRWFGDPSLAEHGRQLRERADTLVRAQGLQRQADERRSEAQQRLQEGVSQAREQRAEATRDHARRVEEAREQAESGKQRAGEQAAATAETRSEQAENRAAARLRAVEADRRRDEERIAEREDHATAKPKAQLREAAEQRGAATRERRTAQRLESLAGQQRTERRTRRAASGS